MRRGDIERECDILSKPQAGALDRCIEQLERRGVRLERRPVAAFVGLQHGQTAFAEHIGGRLVHLDDHRQRLRDSSRRQPA